MQPETALPALALALFAFGAGVGTVDCAVNIQAVIVERSSEQPLMSGFHGLFSVGGIMGAGGVSALLGFGLGPLASICCAVAFSLVVLICAARHFIPYGETSVSARFCVPRGVVLFIGLICFVVFLTEGAMLDWSALFLVQNGGMNPAYAGVGYATFAVTMTVGRLTGDRVVRRLGHVTIVVAGIVCAAIGLLVAARNGSWAASLIGFALVGIGCSNVVPVMYSLIGKQNVMPASAAVPAITTIGYSRILLGPAFIGFLAQQTSLSTALLVVSVALVGVAMSAPRLRLHR